MQAMRFFAVLVGLVVILPVRGAWPSQPDQPDSKSAKEQKGPAKGVKLPAILDQAKLIVQLGHAHKLNSIAVSRDGKFILTGSDDTTACLWEAESGRELRRFRGHLNIISSVAFSPDGKRVLTGSGDGTTSLWDVGTGKELMLFETKDLAPKIAFSPDGTRIATTGPSEETACIWDVATGKAIKQFHHGKFSHVRTVAFSPDGKHLLTDRLWEVETGKELRRFTAARCATFSSDGKYLLTDGGEGSDLKNYSIGLWETASGKLLRSFKGLRGISYLADAIADFSSDGTLILTAGGDGVVHVFERDTGKERKRFKATNGMEVRSAVFSHDGKSILVGEWGRYPTLWDVATAKKMRRFETNATSINSVNFSRDGQWLVIGTGGGAGIWDASTGKPLNQFKASGVTLSAALSPDKRWLATGGWSNADLLDTSTGKIVRKLPVDIGGNELTLLEFSADSSKLLIGGEYSNDVLLLDVSTGKMIHRFEGFHQAAFIPSGAKIVTGGVRANRAMRAYWDARTGKEINRFDDSRADATRGGLILSSDGKTLAVHNECLDVETGKRKQAFAFLTSQECPTAFSPDNQQVVTVGGFFHSFAALYDLRSGKRVREFRGHDGGVTSASISPDGKKLLTGSWDNTARLWDVATGRELCKIIMLAPDSWAVADSAGRYDASNGGDVEGLHWVIGLESIVLKQLKKHYYDPGLLAKYMGLSKQPLRPVAVLKEIHLPPDVQAAPPSKDGKLAVELANRGGGIGRIQVFVNGRELNADARGEQTKTDPDAAKAAFAIELAGAHFLPGEKNVIRLVPWNKEDGMSGRGLILDWDAPGKKEPPDLYAIVVGTSMYAEPKLHLRYAAKDADDFANALELAGQRLLKEFGGKVHMTLLCDSGNPRAKPPTRANLVKALAEARRARPGDVLVVYLAGHGVALQAKDEELYCYLTQEANSTSRSDVADKDWREQNAVSSKELTEWFKQIPANKQVLILDTCAAGAAATKLMEHRETDAEAVRALDQLQERAGFHVLMGCASDKVSYEATRFSQGLLTYSLLEGMKNGTGLKGEFVDIGTLFRHAADKVPQLAQNIGGIQKPLVMAPRGNSFPVGQLLSEDKAKIPLAQPVPLVLRPRLINDAEEDGEDDLKLGLQLAKRLREDSLVGRGGQGPALAFVDADELQGAVRPGGKYKVQGEKITVQLTLRRDGKVVARAEVTGTRNDLAGLATRLAEATAKALKKL